MFVKRAEWRTVNAIMTAFWGPLEKGCYPENRPNSRKVAQKRRRANAHNEQCQRIMKNNVLQFPYLSKHFSNYCK